jgi:tetratricopeptide (TPR) repeat protein
MRTISLLVTAALALAAPAAEAPAAEHVREGDVLENPTLPTLDGARAPLLAKEARANVFIFFRPGQEHSQKGLETAAAWQRDFAGKPVRIVGVVSSRRAPDAVRAALRDAGATMPVLVDEDDQLFGKLGVHLHPVVGIADAQFKVLGFEAWRSVNFDARVRARIRLALGEIDAAAAQRADDPPEAKMPNEVEGAVARRSVHMGEKLLERGQAAKAEQSARRALAKEPSSVEAKVLLGKALAARGKCAEAGKAFDEVLAADGGNREAQEGKRRCGAK